MLRTAKAPVRRVVCEHCHRFIDNPDTHTCSPSRQAAATLDLRQASEDDEKSEG